MWEKSAIMWTRNAGERGSPALCWNMQLKWLPNMALRILLAILLDKNPASIGILEKFGFSRWGALPGIAKIGEETSDHLFYGLKL